MSGNILDSIVDSLTAGKIDVYEFMEAAEDKAQVLESENPRPDDMCDASNNDK
jgi:hypothetical protein